jgi:hypothetical protein
MVEIKKIKKVGHQWIKFLDPGQFFWNENNDSIGIRLPPTSQSTYFCFKREKFFSDEVQVIPVSSKDITITIEV